MLEEAYFALLNLMPMPSCHLITHGRIPRVIFKHFNKTIWAARQKGLLDPIKHLFGPSCPSTSPGLARGKHIRSPCLAFKGPRRLCMRTRTGRTSCRYAVDAHVRANGLLCLKKKLSIRFKKQVFWTSIPSLKYNFDN